MTPAAWRELDRRRHRRILTLRRLARRGILARELRAAQAAAEAAQAQRPEVPPCE